MSTKANVSAAKPAVGGAVSIAPVGTALPTTADADLNQAFQSLGYISEDGLNNGLTRDSETIKAWGGDPVLVTQTEFGDTLNCTFIEALNVNLLKFVFGSDNVSGDLATGITINVNSKELEEVVLVADMILNGALKRVVVPHAKITEMGEVTYEDAGAIGYETTITATPDASGNTHYEYIKSA